MLGFFNFIIFQWFGIRLAFVTSSSHYLLMVGVTPLTGWWSNYHYFLPNPRYVFLISKPINSPESIYKVKRPLVKDVTEICREKFDNYDDLTPVDKSRLHDVVLEWFDVWKKNMNKII